MLGKQRIAELLHTLGRSADRRDLIRLERQFLHGVVAVLVDPARRHLTAALHDGEVREVEIRRP